MYGTVQALREASQDVIGAAQHAVGEATAHRIEMDTLTAERDALQAQVTAVEALMRTHGNWLSWLADPTRPWTG